MTTALTIQQAAEACGLTVHTLRWYERIGLLRPVPRRGNGHRRYRREDMDWIAFLVRLRATGMPVEDMLRYARLRDAGNAPDSVAARRAMLQAHARRVAAELHALQGTLAYLHDKIANYEHIESQLTGGQDERIDGERQPDTLRARLGETEGSGRHGR